jgi:hypothetical protein
MKRMLMVLLLAGAASRACAGDIPFRGLCAGDDAVYGARKAASVSEVALARDGDEMRRVWAEDVTGAYRDAQGMPAVDWDREFVVAVFLGARPAAGHGVRIEGVALKGKVLEVAVREVAPTAPAPPRPVSPYAMAACPRAQIPLAGILMLRLVETGGPVIAERPAWSYRLMDSSIEGAAGGGER